MSAASDLRDKCEAARTKAPIAVMTDERSYPDRVLLAIARADVSFVMTIARAEFTFEKMAALAHTLGVVFPPPKKKPATPLTT